MRDPGRIEELLGFVAEAWKRDPDQRLGQLLVNLVGPAQPCPELFYLEDNDLRKRLIRQAVEARLAAPPEPNSDDPKVIAHVGGVVDETRVSLAVYGPDLRPDDITAALGVEPTRSHSRGDSRRPNSRPFKQGAWFLTVEGFAPKGPQEVTEELLDLLPGDPERWTALSESYDVQLRYGMHFTGWNRGFSLTPALAKRIAVLEARLEFDLYAYGEK